VSKSIINTQAIVFGLRDQIILEKVNEELATIHVVRMPTVREKGFYRSSISATYWRERENTNWYEKFYLKRKVCPRSWTVMMARETSACHRVLNDPNNVGILVLEHETIWDFYKYIGYDYKTQRYTKVNSELQVENGNDNA
jgi:hypothetical protein